MDQIAQAVRASGRTHRSLAAALGLTPPSFSDRMSGRIRWSLVDAVALAKELDVSLDELVGAQDLELGYALTEAAPA